MAQEVQKQPNMHPSEPGYLLFACKSFKCKMRELEELAPPAAHDLRHLSEYGVRSARKLDIDYLTRIFQEREWRPADVATAQLHTDMLGGVFASKKVWRLRMSSLRSILEKVATEHCNPGLAVAILP
eukprot:6204112-Pleurochrysis_carterae.AAC.5